MIYNFLFFFTFLLMIYKYECIETIDYLLDNDIHMDCYYRKDQKVRQNNVHPVDE